MDGEEHEQIDVDFESLLDSALGIEGPPAPQHAAPTHAMPKHSSAQHSAQSMIVGSPVAYDQTSASCSPSASPVHYYQPSPCSPCISSSSMQMHAPVGDHSSSFSYSVGMYSPVRESGSPPPDQYSPVHEPPVHNSPITSAKKDSSSMQPVATPPQQTGQQQDDPQQRVEPHVAPQQSHQPQTVQLCALPREVQMRVLCFLSADALTSLGCCNQQLRALCNEPVLWRRLFVHRWGKKVKQNNNWSWKARYIERDATELRAAGAAAGEPRDTMHDMFVQAMVAKRQQALGRAAVDDLMLVDDDEIAAKVAAWRKSRGFDHGTAAGAATEPQRPTDITQHLPTAGSGHRQGGLGGFGGCKRPGVAKRRAAGPLGPQQQQQQQHLQQQRQQCKGGGSSSRSQELLGGNSQQQSSTSNSRQVAEGSAGAKTAGTAAAADAAGTAAVQSSGSRDADRSAAAGSTTVVATDSPTAGSTCTAAAAAAAFDDRAVKRQRRRWTQIGNVFCDEMTGWIHVCDETCSEKIVEPSSGLLVCPISGIASDRMMTCAEEEAEEGPREGDGEAAVNDVNDDYSGEKGRLARAFAAGYYCSDEKELLRTCGVRLSR